MYGYTISARMDIKQENFLTEKLLQYYAEPFSSIASLFGGSEEGKYLEKAWNYLIQNSAHDSIGGCSLDEIHDDMKWRYRQCRQISEGVLSRSFQAIVKNISSPSDDKNGINLIVFNPLPFSRSQIKKLFVDIPEEMDKNGFVIKDQTGDKVEYVILKKEPVEPVLEQLTDRPLYLKMFRYTCLVAFKAAPALGYKSYSVYPVKPIKEKGKLIGRRVKGLPLMENNLVKVTVNRNGTINLLDKQTGYEIKNTGYFYDEGEAGHAWVNKPISPFVTSLKSKPEISLSNNSILTAECKISYLMELPINVVERNLRKGKTVKQKIDCFIKLDRNSKRVNYRIELDNTAESHRLRILFPSGIKSDYSFGEGQFDIVKRSTERPDTSSWVEQPMYDYPMHHFAAVSDGEKGAAVLVEGLKEYEVLPDKSTIAITLLRCFEYVIQPSSIENYSYMKGSQCPGKHIFKLAVYPYYANNTVDVLNEALRFNYELRAVQTGHTNGALPSAGSFISISSPEIIMSCFKISEDRKGYILRLYNSTDKEVRSSLRFMFLITGAQIVSLEEIPLKQMEIMKGSQLEVLLKKKEILTIKLYFS
jgi:mannosylglycerate hydrolase